MLWSTGILCSVICNIPSATWGSGWLLIKHIDLHGSLNSPFSFRCILNILKLPFIVDSYLGAEWIFSGISWLMEIMLGFKVWHCVMMDSVLTTSLIGCFLVRPLADAWMGIPAPAHFHIWSGWSMALVSPSIFKEGLETLICGLLPPPLGFSQTPLQEMGWLRSFGWLGAQGSWVQGHAIAGNTYDVVYSSARCVTAAYAGTAELTFIWLFWVQTAMTAP